MTPQYDLQLLRSCGQDVYLSANVEIRRPHLVSVGHHVAIDTGFYCTTQVEIGDYIHIAPYVTVIGGERALLRMEHFSSLAAGCRVAAGSDEHLGFGIPGPTIPEQFHDRLIIEPVHLKMFANVGTNVVILPGVTLAEGSVIGACSLVTKDTEPWTIYTGVPARPMKARPREKMIEAAKAMGYL
jgi:dTDP-4-amino-4,6-dideoxy-D-glucose acyltransferase